MPPFPKSNFISHFYTLLDILPPLPLSAFQTSPSRSLSPIPKPAWSWEAALESDVPVACILHRGGRDLSCGKSSRSTPRYCLSIFPFAVPTFFFRWTVAWRMVFANLLVLVAFSLFLFSIIVPAFSFLVRWKVVFANSLVLFPVS